MKKFISLLISGMMFTCLFTVGAQAETPEPSLTDEEVRAIIVETFPEYAMARNSLPASDPTTESEPPKIVSTETRQYSEDIDVTRMAYDDGSAAYVTALTNSVSFDTNWTSSGSSYTRYNVNIFVQLDYPYMGSMSVSGFDYTINNDSYDQINSVGSLVTSMATNPQISHERYNEDSAGSAQVFYSGTFEHYLTGGMLQRTLVVYVGNNSRSYTLT